MFLAASFMHRQADDYSWLLTVQGNSAVTLAKNSSLNLNGGLERAWSVLFRGIGGRT